jgi:Pao retrotransposon peptidase
VFQLLQLHGISPSEVDNIIPSSSWWLLLTTVTTQKLGVRFDELPTEKAIGLLWNCNEDSFGFSFKMNSPVVTKRDLLRVISSTFHPLGMLAPIILKDRIILKKVCWNWDTELPECYMRNGTGGRRHWPIWTHCAFRGVSKPVVMTPCPVHFTAFAMLPPGDTVRSCTCVLLIPRVR